VGAGVTGLPAAGGANDSSSEFTAAAGSTSPLAGAMAALPAGGRVSDSGTSNEVQSSAPQATQLVQAMAGFTDGGGAADTLSSAPLGADTSQQTLLTAPQHG